jgi:hypothetical protein
MSLRILDPNSSPLPITGELDYIEVPGQFCQRLTIEITCKATFSQENRLRINAFDRNGGSWPLFDVSHGGKIVIPFTVMDADQLVQIVAVLARPRTIADPLHPISLRYTKKQSYDHENYSCLATDDFLRAHGFGVQNVSVFVQLVPLAG